jgi:hypothetical protein
MHLKKRTIDDDATFELIEHVCKRPRAYYADANSFRELLAFINGISCGMHPPHGCFGIVADYVWERFQSPTNVPWTTVVLDEFGDLPYRDAREALAKLFRDYRATLG